MSQLVFGSDGRRRGGEVFFVYWGGYKGHPGGQIILWWRQKKMTAGNEGHQMKGGEGGVGGSNN